MRLEAEWKYMRDSYLRRFDFSEEWLTSKLPAVSEMSEDSILKMAQAIGVSPSTQQVRLFISRFGKLGRVSSSDIKRILLSTEPLTIAARYKETVGPDTMEAVRAALSCLFRNLYSIEKLKHKFAERKIPLEEAFKAFDTYTVDEKALRDSLLNRNVMPSTKDIQALIHLVAGEASAHFTQEQLRAFLKADFESELK